jgi:hypothetical protein
MMGSINSFDGSLESWINLSWVVIAPLSAILTLCTFYKVFCPRGDSPEELHKAKRRFIIITIPLFVAGLVTTGCGSYMMWNYELVAGYVSQWFVGCMLGGGIMIIIMCIVAVFAASREYRYLIVVYLIIGCVCIAGIIAFASFCAKFASDINGVRQESLAQTGRAEKSNVAEGKKESYRDKAYKRMIAYSCNTYQTCCEPSALLNRKALMGAPRQCQTQHQGETDDTAFVLQDPSNPKFCEYISGHSSNYSAAKGMCHLIEREGDGFTLEACQRNYCVLGVEGYEDFLSITVRIYRTRMRIAALVTGATVTFFFVQIVNLFFVLKISRRVERLALMSDPDFDQDKSRASWGSDKPCDKE